MPIPSGITIQSGAKLVWRQYQDGTAVPKGWIGVVTTIGTNMNWWATDQDGQEINSDTTQNAWHNRVVDLTSIAGQTLSTMWINEDAGTGAGSWDEYFADMAIVQPDGTVVTLYNNQPGVNFGNEWDSGGVSNQSFVAETVWNYDIPSQTTHYFLGDHLGSARMEFAGEGWPVWAEDYAPYGQEIAPQPTANLYKFTGQERDPESASGTDTGNDFFNARYYNSFLGRFLSPDPSGQAYADPTNPQSLNLYSYVRNNPLINIDPTGMECVWSDGSYDSNDDSSTGDSAVDGSGNHTGCSGQGGTWIDHSYFTGNDMADWSSQVNSDLADMTVPTATVNAGPWDLATFKTYASMWSDGTLPTKLDYGPNDPATLAMINRPYVQNQLAAYKAAGCPATGTKAGQPSGAAFRESAGDVASGSPNYVQMEVGGYSGNFTTSGGVTTVTLSNISGISSFVGYSGVVAGVNTVSGSHFSRNALDSTNGPGRNVTQTFIQTMPSPCGGG